MPWIIADDQVPETAMLWGAVVGEQIAGLSLYLARGR